MRFYHSQSPQQFQVVTQSGKALFEHLAFMFSN